MIERKLSSYPSKKKYIMNIKMNEFVFYNRNKRNNDLIGFYTEGIVLYRAVVISLNTDEFKFFAHIYEKSDLKEQINNYILPLFNSDKIKNIDIIYSKGLGGLSNDEKKKIILDLINLIEQINSSKKEIYYHKISTSCLKLIKIEDSQNQIIFKNLINYKTDILDK